jgi:hypothetical protein
MKMKIQPTRIFAIYMAKAVLRRKFIAISAYIKKETNKTQRSLK